MVKINTDRKHDEEDPLRKKTNYLFIKLGRISELLTEEIKGFKSVETKFYKKNVSSLGTLFTQEIGVTVLNTGCPAS